MTVKLNSNLINDQENIYQTTANLSQTLDDSTTKYPSNKAVKTAIDNIPPSTTITYWE